jgi:hypothetical protein
MLADFIRVITQDGPVTLKRNSIIAINPTCDGTMIVVEASDNPQVYISTEDYDNVVMTFLSA